MTREAHRIEDPGATPVLDLAVIEMADAAGVLAVIHAAFGARAQVDPPPPALSETVESITREIRGASGVVARIGERVAGVILLQPISEVSTSLRRVSVHPDFQGRGVATAMVEAVCDVAAELGYLRAQLYARKEFPRVVAWWQHRGFRVVEESTHGFGLSRRLPEVVAVPTAEAMHRLGIHLAGLLHAGDVVIATGELGAGKTTLAQGIGRGLGITDAITSPTFVISQVHANSNGSPDLVHVDAYRLGDQAEIDDIDLDSDLPRAVTVVEWGAGIADQLSPDRLEVEIVRSDDPEDETRHVYLWPIGPRWEEVRLAPGAPSPPEGPLTSPEGVQ